jgi:hypothetical protein
MGIVLGLIFVLVGLGVIALVALPIIILIGNELVGFVREILKEPFIQFIFSVTGLIVAGAFLVLFGLIMVAANH